jgi:hypothetical protein
MVKSPAKNKILLPVLLTVKTDKVPKTALIEFIKSPNEGAIAGRVF